MSLYKLLGAIALCVISAATGRADDALPMEVEQNLAAIQQPYAQLAVAEAPPAGPPIVPSQYVQQPYVETPYDDPTMIAPPEPCCEVCGTSGGCECVVGCYRSGWTLGFELYGLRSQVTRAEFGPWPDDLGGAARITLGYEWINGFGIRAISWGFSDKAKLPGDDVELSLGAFHLDFYKAILSSHGELLLGAGPAFGSVEFRIPADRDRSEFRGGGGSVFAYGYYPFYLRPRWEFAFVGQTRMSLLAGDWNDDTNSVIPDTEHDSMSVFEIAFGLEFRRRFGRLAEHYWFVRLMPEFQQWSSDWMGNFLGSSVGLSGTSLNFGVTW